MHRGNRRFLVASTLLAIPVALLMVSLSGGTDPTIKLAVGHSNDDSGAIQQVIGKQLSSGSQHRRAGVRTAIAEESSQTNAKSQPTHRHHTHAAKPEPPQGLLDGLFNGRSESKKPTPAKQVSKSRASSSKPSNQPADWDGIPYHNVNTAVTSSGKAPIRDPNQATPTATATRIIRGGSSRSVTPTPASVRRSSQPTLAGRPAPALARPVPPPEARSYDPTNSHLSNSSSSRRSGRRVLGPLDASEVAAAAKRPTLAAQANNDPNETLVPRVKRREIEDVAPQVAPSPTEVVTTTPAVDAPSPATTPTAEVVAVDSGQAATAVGQIESATPHASADETAATPNQPTSTLSAPKTSTQPAYTTPGPATQGVPTAGVPSHPYAASTPASHRVGPPHAAFEPRQSVPQFSPASTPVGSGVANRVPSGEVATYRSPANHPQADPYAPTSKRMTTFGQPAETEAAPLPIPNGPAPATAVPMHPINGYQRTADTRNHATHSTSDDFSASQYDAQRQNRMRAGSNQQPIAAGQNSVASELPGIRVATHGPAEIMIRQTHQYEIRVENRGSIDAKGVMVRALIPDWAEIRGQNASRGGIDTEVTGSTERLVWTIDHLPAGATERMFVRLKAAHSGTYDLDVDWTLVPQKSVAKVRVHEPKLALTIDGPEEVVYGQSQTYKVRVMNPGDGTAPNVVFTLSPNSATPSTQRIGDIPPGKEAQFEVELTAQDLGDLKIHGLAAGDLELRAESSKTIHVAAAELVAMLSGPELKYQNSDANYHLQVQNTGAATSERIVATLRLPAGVKYTGGLENATQRGADLRWEIDALTSGAMRNYQFRCNMTSTGEHVFSFDCKGTAAGKADVTLATRVESIADLVLSISDPTAPAPIGTDVTYEIIVRNRGSKEATNIRAIAQFSHGIEPLRIEGHSGEVVTGQVMFDPIDRIAAGQEVRLRVIAQADSAGHHRFRSEVRSGDTVLVAEEATHYMSPKSDRVSRRSNDNETR